MTRSIALMLGALILVPVPVLAQTESSTAATSATTDPNAPEAVKCKRTPVTGSLVKKVRVCKTNAEWKRIREGNDSELQGMMDTYRAGSSQTGG